MWLLLGCSLAGQWDGTAPHPSVDDTGAGTTTTTPEHIGPGDTRAPTAGELVITEIMDDPDDVADDVGEWFEVQSVATVTLTLTGLQVEDEDGEDFAVDTTLTVAPGARLLFGASADPDENGGLTPDVVFDTDDFHLGDDADEIVLRLDDLTLDEVAYDHDFPARAGRSRSLDPADLDPEDNDDPDAWCDGLGSYGGADEGTPGAPNDACP